MSVINKMLRDLDQRKDAHAPTASPGTTPATSALRHGTASVSFGKPIARVPPKSRVGLWLGIAALAIATVSAGAWLWWQSEAATIRVDITATPPAAASLPGSAAAVASSAVPAATAPADSQVPESDPSTRAAAPEDAASSATGSVAGPATAMTLRMESSLSARKALDALLSTPTPVAAPVAVQSPTPTVGFPATTTAPTPAVAAATERPKSRTASPPATSTPAPASESAAPTIQRQQQAGGDAIAQAQNLWNSGSHDAAIDLMQQSIAAAERSAKAGTPSGAANALLVPLVREMARMQLAEARFGAVWEMLTRLEPLLGNQADLWAIRANAAQRLGRHQDSVHAYMMALQSRPDEQRWLLGTAVSLAALGQTSSAAEMAEKARALGPVSKDILAYLRQTGVPLRDQ